MGLCSSDKSRIHAHGYTFAVDIRPRSVGDAERSGWALRDPVCFSSLLPMGEARVMAVRGTGATCLKTEKKNASRSAVVTKVGHTDRQTDRQLLNLGF